MTAPRGSFSGNYAFHVACGVALYSVSSFALLAHLDVAPVYTCLAAALAGLGR